MTKQIIKNRVIIRNAVMFKDRVIIRNAVMCPDGTYLRSYHVHDYKEHTDSVTKEVIMVDGGNLYLRRSINKVPPEDLTFYLDSPFKLVRQAFTWLSYGKNKECTLGEYICLCDMTTEHISAILLTQDHIKGTYVEELFKQELEYRSKQSK